MATKSVKILSKKTSGTTRKSKETKFGPKKGSTPPGNHSNIVKVG